MSLMDDVNRLRNNDKMKKISLRQLSMKSVLENAAIYCSSLDFLPQVLKTDLESALGTKVDSDCLVSVYYDGLDYYLVMEKWRRFMTSLLFGDQLTKLHVPSSFFWMEGNHDSFLKLMDEIPVKGPGLQLFEAKDKYFLQPTDQKENPSLQLAFFRALPQLINLQVVRINFFLCNDWALQQFGKHGNNLVVLQIGLDSDVTKAGFEALSTLSNLQQLLFGDCDESWALQRKCLIICAQILPKLRIVGREFNDLDCESPNGDDHFYHNQVLQTPCQLSLEKLVLSGKVNLHKSCQVPKLRELHLFQPCLSMVGLINGSFSSVTEIAIYEADEDTVMPVLAAVGVRLHKLAIDQTEGVSLFGILQHCPQMTHLTLKDCTLEAFNVELGGEIFSSLQEVSIENEFLEPLQYNFITKLLVAPQLKRVELYEVYLTLSQVDELLGLVHRSHQLSNKVSIFWSNSFLHRKPWMAPKENFQRLLNALLVTPPHPELYNKLRVANQ